MFGKLKKIYTNYINRLSETNEKEFGKKGLDCCELNKKKD